MKLKELTHYTGEILQVERFRDYCPNGLQVEGKQEVSKIVAGVTASMDLLEAAHAAGADLILVHHGYFWRNEDARVIGMKRARIKFLLEHEINLLAYHLPLDAHAEYGNNVQLAKKLGFQLEGWAGEQNIIAYGTIAVPVSLQQLGAHINQQLNREPLLIGEQNKLVKRIAWCTGAAQDYIEQAIDLGVDVFISGEISERTVHLARESGVAYIAAGHHATERYGVQALGEHLATHFNLGYEWIDIDNPV
ncbi:Nif3-like dinuclear metal center hexameric protein [Methyloradius palustris]|uniref:GTP cyclohydrolase 1 type 2 homolog n=1 Tax=Methyloradius palustris TaxID=2778876 RepID=A0A8D5JVC5_9PROT|nr:Nif3-like dinuclear metal center hexameric protein [Methyloradius palustris]BCM23999.1 GTP cyclohydrolase 1 type 2 [Methyloradius palustris]